jgi:hypothetical protein
MNQEPGDCVATHLELQWSAVAGWSWRGTRGAGGMKVVRIQRRDGRHKCPECGRRQASGRLFAQREPVCLRSCSIGGWETCLEVRPMRITYPALEVTDWFAPQRTVPGPTVTWCRA